MPGSALNSLLRQGPPPTPDGGPRQGSPVPDMPMNGAAPAAPGPPGGNPLAALLQQSGGAPAQKPSPDHQQTVVALVHLQAVKKQFAALSKLPGIGKENIRPAIFDSIAGLLGQSMFTLPQVMTETRNIPADPPGQKQWVLQHLSNIVEAQKHILLDHAQSNPSSGDSATDLANLPPQDPSQSHTDMMGDVVGHYDGKRR